MMLRRGGPLWPPAFRATTQGCPYRYADMIIEFFVPEPAR